MSTPIHFDIAFLGYNMDLSKKGLKEFAENNKEQVEKIRFNSCDYELYLKDGTRIKAIGYSENWLHGYKFDQLMLFDDDRWNIEIHKEEEIRMIKTRTMYMSNVPKEYQVLYYEDL